MENEFKCSILIPTKNSGKTLKGTLDAILGGECLPDEILVIDGLSNDDTVEIARSIGVRILINKKIHVAAARQLGVLKARYSIIVFIDSDCIPSSDWLKKILENFKENPNLDGIGGKVVLCNPVNKVQKYSAFVFESIMKFPDKRIFVVTRKMAGTFPGANCAFKKSAILSVGGFSVFFSNHAEEVDLVWRMIREKKILIFDPEIIVDHLEYPDTIMRLVRANFNYGIASTKLAKFHIGNQVDFKLYKAFFGSFLSGINPWSNDKIAWLRFTQIGAFIIGKIYSSIKYRTINL